MYQVEVAFNAARFQSMEFPQVISTSGIPALSLHDVLMAVARTNWDIAELSEVYFGALQAEVDMAPTV